MGALKDRLQAQIEKLEAEIERIDVQAAESKARIQASLDALKEADAVLTPEVEALIAKLRLAGINVLA